MLKIRRHPLLAALLVTCVLAFVAEQVLAQNPTIKGKGKYLSTVSVALTIAANGQSATAVDLIPEKMTFVITDVVVSNSTASSASFVINQLVVDAGTKTGAIEVGPMSSFAHNFGTGFEFPAGSRVAIFANNQALTATLVGYMKKA